MNILSQIVESKEREVALLQEQPGPGVGIVVANNPLFYTRLDAARAAGQPFFIAEFKRKSPSEGWINRQADLPAQLRAYARAGAGAISVLTDQPFFGGSYADLQTARTTLDTLQPGENKPLLLQKDFILDPKQIRLAKQYGADIILLIAAILKPERLDFLRQLAESLGLGVLVEVHDEQEFEQIKHLDFQVLGVNNRDLKTFRTALNRFNVLRERAGKRFVIAESGVLDYRHFQMLRRADGFLIGTGLMREANGDFAGNFRDHFRQKGHYLFKACGIRRADTLAALQSSSPDFIGINFSPRSRRGPDAEALNTLQNGDYKHLTAVFYQNSPAEIREVLEKFPFRTVQFYAGDVSPELVRSIKARVLMAVKVPSEPSWTEIMTDLVAPYAADVDCFILDGVQPGSGRPVNAVIPAEFPYPFLLAGGIGVDNLQQIRQHPQCIGVDIASGIETDGEVDIEKIALITDGLRQLSQSSDLTFVN